jgi:hypothetical protein
VRAAVVALTLSTPVAAQQPPLFTPPRIARSEVPAPPPPTVVGGGEVLIEATIDRSGAVTRPVLLRSTPPYAQLVLDAVVHWRFMPATLRDPKGVVNTIEAPVLIAAVYRPPAMFNGPTAGEPPRELRAASGDVAYPSALISPAYPPNALNAIGAVVLFEVLLDEAGHIRQAVPIATDPAFEGAAWDALKQWTFRPAVVLGRPAPAAAYVLFGFRPVVLSSAPAPPLPPKR